MAKLRKLFVVAKVLYKIFSQKFETGILLHNVQFCIQVYNKTTFSFKTPSVEEIDYVKESRNINEGYNKDANYKQMF